MEAGADLDYPSKVTGFSAMAMAAKRGDAVMVHHLLDLGASAAMPVKYKKVGSAGFSAAAGDAAGEVLFPNETEDESKARRRATRSLGFHGPSNFVSA